MAAGLKPSTGLLDVLDADQFKDDFDPAFFQTEENFYRGAPPNWLNFHISDQPNGTCFVKRDGYEELKKKIQEKRRLPGISNVKLFHQSGSGGSTLAMQVMWDLREDFHCAVLTDSTTDITKVAEEVVKLFTVGRKQKTVLLLVNEEQILDKLQKSVMRTVKERNIVRPDLPVVTLLSCVRKEVLQQNRHVVLKRELSDTEKLKFDEKKKELTAKYKQNMRHLHGFNIIQSNFSEAYINQACTVFSSPQEENRALKTQLAAFLSLLNAYVPGSYLLESQCLDFLKPENSIKRNIMQASLEELMQPFSHLIVTFQQNERSDRKVRMAHTLLAECSTELLSAAGVTRSDTARKFLNIFCRNNENGEFPQCLQGFVKDMLTNRTWQREPKAKEIQKSDKDNQEKFSRLILDIMENEDKNKSASVLREASEKFPENPFFPQALARFCYIELKDYDQAEKWAKIAKERYPQNSFIADTLGQVYKNKLKNEEDTKTPREILFLAEKAIDAFKHEEQLAEEEHELNMKDDEKSKVSHVFNYRGQFGILQVCKILHELLVSNNETWRAVLTKNMSFCSALETLGDTELYRFKGLISNLRDEVERRAEFIDKYLTYSKPSIDKDYPEYILSDTTECHRMYVGDSTPQHTQPKEKLKKNLAATSVGVLTSLDRGYTEDVLQEITECWEKICSSEDPETAAANYILATVMLKNAGVTFHSSTRPFKIFKEKMPLRDSDPPEEHMALLLHCLMDNEEGLFDLRQILKGMHGSYEHAYKKYFSSKYLLPLFFIGKGEKLDRIIHRTVFKRFFTDQCNEMTPKWKPDWSHENMFDKRETFLRNEQLLRVEGEVKNYKLSATFDGTEIEIKANLRRSLWKPRPVSFYLGFTIKGPVAFDIQTKNSDHDLNGSASHINGAGWCGGSTLNSSLDETLSECPRLSSKNPHKKKPLFYCNSF